MEKSSIRDKKVQALRLHQIDEIIRGGGYPTAKALALALEVSERTVMRDIDFLRDRFNAPLEYDKEHGGWYYTEKSYFLKYISINESEVLFVALLKTLLNEYKNTPIKDSIQALLNRFLPYNSNNSDNSDNNSNDSNNSKGSNFYKKASGFSSQYITYICDKLSFIDYDTFNTILKALSSKKSVTFDYHSLLDSDYKSRCVDIYHIVYQKGSWYAIGFCHKKGDIRLFSFSRMKNLCITESVYNIPRDFEPKKYIDSDMGVWANEREEYLVRLQFDKEIALFAKEKVWHDGQKVFDNDDGSVTVEFETTQITEVMRLVLSQGGSCKALAPKVLQERLIGEAKKIVQKYL